MEIRIKRLSVAATVVTLMSPSFQAVADRSVRLGESSPLQPPFCETFDNFRQGMEHDDFERYFQVIDANNDGRSWAIYNYSTVTDGRSAMMLFPMTDVTRADDWLVTRAVRLEAGKYYLVNLDARLYNTTTPDLAQRFEVKVGAYNDADGMTTTVIPVTDINSSVFTHHQGWFKPRATGLYYIGVHGISPSYGDSYYNYLFIDNIAVDSPRSGSEPGPVVVNSVMNDPDGTPKVAFSLTAPAVDIAGNALTASMDIEVSRDGEVIMTLENVAPGESKSFDDVTAADGEHLYRFIARNASGESQPVVLRHISGIGAPMPPGDVTLTETADQKVLVSWTPTDKDVNGNALNSSKIFYRLYDVSTGSPMFAGATEDGEVSMIYEPELKDGAQTLATLAVVAVMNEAESEMAPANPLPVGNPYGLPYANSFTMADYVKYVMIVNGGDKDVTWRMLDDNSDPHAQDGDHGYVCMIGNAPGQQCELLSGKIDMDADDLSLSFYTYVYADDENFLEVTVTDCATGETKVVAVVDYSEYNAKVGWTHIRFDLSEFAHRTIQLGLTGHIVTHGYIPVDNMVIDKRPAIDLEVTQPVYPASAEVGVPFEVTASVINHGVSQSGPLTVELLCDDKAIATAQLRSLGRGENDEVILNHTFTSVSSPMSRFRLSVSHPDEALPDDNITDPFQIAMEVPSLPVPAQLESRIDGGGNVALSWNAPDLAKAAPAAKTEGFEECEPFSQDLGDWTTFDADGGYVGGFDGMEMPVDNTRQGFWVMDNDDYAFIIPHSGKRAAVQMYGFKNDDSHTTPLDCDDWLISPELYGGPQTVSFWVKSYNNHYGLELFEVLASSTGDNTSDFTTVMDVTEAPDSWTRFVATLPDGTRHFAIRCTSPNIFMLLVDDITFAPTGAPLPLELNGYKVYVNDNCVSGADPIAATSFNVPSVVDGDRLNVTAVYDKGESVPATIVFGSASVDMVTGDDCEAPAEYYNLQGIRVSEDNLLPGIYIRRVGAKSQKVIIRR